MASGWDFIGIRNPESRSRGFRIGVFYFGLDRKTRKSRNPGDQDVKTSKKSREQNPENPGNRDLDSKIPEKSRDFYPGIFEKSPGSGFFCGMGFPDKKPPLSPLNGGCQCLEDLKRKLLIDPNLL